MRIWLFVFLSLVLSLSGVFAQTSSFQNVYFVNPEMVVKRSAIGREIYDRREIAKSNLSELEKKIAAELDAEEESLTNIRDTMTADEFALLAKAFNDKTEAERERINDITAHEDSIVNYRLENLSQLVRNEINRVALERDDATILDQRYAFYVNPEQDITQLIIDRLDLIYATNPQSIENAIFDVPESSRKPGMIHSNQSDEINSTAEVFNNE